MGHIMRESQNQNFKKIVDVKEFDGKQDFSAVFLFNLTSLIMSMSSASVGFCPRERITVPSSLVVMVPISTKKRRRGSQISL